MSTTPAPALRGFRRRPVALVVATIGVAMAIVAGRVVFDARAALSRGQSAEDVGDATRAIRAYLDAARGYLPGNPYSDAAFGRLWALAEAARGENPRTERAALEAFRAAALGSRSFYTPQAERLAQVDARLAALLAAAEVEAGGQRSRGVGQDQDARRRAWHARRLAERPGPAPGLVIMAMAGFVLWVCAVVFFILRGLGPGLRIERGAATVSVVGFVIGLALFVLGLSA